MVKSFLEIYLIFLMYLFGKSTVRNYTKIDLVYKLIGKLPYNFLKNANYTNVINNIN